MEVRLAGYNLDSDTINSLENKANLPLTPETISAAYARITGKNTISPAANDRVLSQGSSNEMP
ncbi:MAG: hypothetical protein V1843_01700 [bacterium]